MLFGCFRVELEKNYRSYLKSAPLNLHNAELYVKQKTFSMPPKLSYLGIFMQQFSNVIVMFEINTLEFVELQIFIQKEKHFNLGPKMRYLGTFRPEFGKSNVILDFSTLKFVIMQSFM